MPVVLVTRGRDQKIVTRSCVADLKRDVAGAVASQSYSFATPVTPLQLTHLRDCFYFLRPHFVTMQLAKVFSPRQENPYFSWQK